MSNLEEMKFMVLNGKESFHIRVFTIMLGNNRLDVTYNSKEKKVSSAILYSSNMSNYSWLNDEELKEFSIIVAAYLNEEQEIYY